MPRTQCPCRPSNLADDLEIAQGFAATFGRGAGIRGSRSTADLPRGGRCTSSRPSRHGPRASAGPHSVEPLAAIGCRPDSNSWRYSCTSFSSRGSSGSESSAADRSLRHRIERLLIVGVVVRSWLMACPHDLPQPGKPRIQSFSTLSTTVPSACRPRQRIIPASAKNDHFLIVAGSLARASASRTLLRDATLVAWRAGRVDQAAVQEPRRLIELNRQLPFQAKSGSGPR